MTNRCIHRFAALFEWGTLYLLVVTEKNIVPAEAVHGVYDGSLFFDIERSRRESQPPNKTFFPSKEPSQNEANGKQVDRKDERDGKTGQSRRGAGSDDRKVATS